MRTSDDLQLAPPGAGLPLLELWAARLLFGLLRWRGNRGSFVARFEQERAAIREVVNSCPEARRGERVLITRLRGLEDSSRNWSVWMTLDHLRITNMAVAQVVTALTQGQVPKRKASTAAVKPSPTVTAVIEDEFERSCDAVLKVLKVLTDGTELRTRLRFAHPWFGPLNALGWAAMAGMHMGLHRAQIQSILVGLRSA